MASFTHTIPVEASAEHLWTLVCAVDRVAGLFPYTQVDELISPEPDCWVFWRRLTIPNVADLRWRELAKITGEGKLGFCAIEGDLQTFAGCWLVEGDGSASTLTLALEYEIPEAVGPNMPAMMVNYVMGEIFKSICQRVKEAAEEVTA